MGSFGERLRREREMRGVTLEEISESTKISSRSLRALEEEKFDTLPGGIFNKGFVRAYARYLNIDEDQAVADFVVASGGEKEQPLPDPPVPRAVALGQRTDARPNWRGFVLLVLLFVTAVAAVSKLGPLAFRKVAAGLTDRFQSKQASPSTLPTLSDVSETAPPAAPAQKKPVPRAKAVTVAASDAAPAPPVASDAVAAPSAQAPASAFVVEIRATQDAWVQIVADGKLMSEGVLVPPVEKRVHAAKEVVIRTGNAAGVEVSFNGQPLAPLGEANQAATVTLTAGGVRR